MREMSAKESFESGKYGSFEHVLFLFCFGFDFVVCFFDCFCFLFGVVSSLLESLKSTL